MVETGILEAPPVTRYEKEEWDLRGPNQRKRTRRSQNQKEE